MKLISGWQNWWKLWSVRISAVATVAWACLLAFPDMMLQVMNALPPDLKVVLPPAAPMAIFVAVTLARVLKQEKLGGDK